jgi:hypothetical protein
MRHAKLRVSAVTVCSLAIALIIMSCVTTPTERFSIPQVGFSVCTPPGWRNLGSNDDFFYTLKGPEGQIRLHFAHRKARTPEEALQYSAARMIEMKKRMPGVNTLQSSEPFRTRSGIKGVKGSFGRKGQELPDVIKYFAANSEGRVVCICIDSCKTVEDFELLERLVLHTLQRTP